MCARALGVVAHCVCGWVGAPNTVRTAWHLVDPTLAPSVGLIDAKNWHNHQTKNEAMLG